VWRGKQLEYSFRLTAMGRYEDFGWVTAHALGFAPAVGARLPVRETERLAGLRDGCPGRRGRPGWSPATRSTVGAGAAGMRTAWVNRSAAPFDTIGQPPDLTVPALDRLPAALAG